MLFVPLRQNSINVMAQKIIGREQEIKDLTALYQTNKPIFAVV